VPRASHLIAAQSIRALRLRLEMSQERLAERSGLHRTYIGAIERGERNITLITLDRIASALGVPATDLISQGPKQK
jgi:transcriptional regulator with XRE-family HTH domain